MGEYKLDPAAMSMPDRELVYGGFHPREWSYGAPERVIERSIAGAKDDAYTDDLSPIDGDEQRGHVYKIHETTPEAIWGAYVNEEPPSLEALEYLANEGTSANEDTSEKVDSEVENSSKARNPANAEPRTFSPVLSEGASQAVANAAANTTEVEKVIELRLNIFLENLNGLLNDLLSTKGVRSVEIEPQVKVTVRGRANPEVVLGEARKTHNNVEMW